MAIFMVIIDREEKAVKKRLDAAYPGSYSYHEKEEKIFLVRTTDIAEDVAVNVGIKGENKIENVGGAVFKLNASYAGFTSKAVWDWLTKDDE